MPDEEDDACPHDNVVEAVDEDGHLVEPAYDVCVDCGKVFY